MRTATYAELRVGDFMSCPDTGYSGLVLSVVLHEADIEFEIEGCGPLYMRPDSEVCIYYSLDISLQA